MIKTKLVFSIAAPWSILSPRYNAKTRRIEYLYCVFDVLHTYLYMNELIEILGNGHVLFVHLLILYFIAPIVLCNSTLQFKTIKTSTERGNYEVCIQSCYHPM